MQQGQKIARLLILGGILACSRTPAEDCQIIPNLCTEIKTHSSITLRIYRNFLLVAEGQIGGRAEPYNLVLDTGTAPSIIEAKLARELQLTTRASAMTVIGKLVATQTALLPELALGPIRVVSLRVQVQDLSRLQRDLGMPVAGIIGLDVLSKSSFRLDYDKKRIEFGDFSGEGIPVPYDERSGIAVARVELDGKPKRFLVDTGTDRVALLGGNSAGTEGLGLRNTAQEGSSVADQAMRVQIFFAPDILLGKRHFTVEKAYFIPGSADPAFDGLLGVRALGFRVISYDRKRGTLYLQK